MWKVFLKMSLSDLLFPGNPGRRTQVVSLSTQIKTYMEVNFNTTNTLIDLLNEHVSPSPNLQKIFVDLSISISDNANRLISRMEQIQAIVDDYDAQLAKDLEPDLYRKLTDPDIKFVERIRVAKVAVTAVLAVAATVATIVVVAAVKAGYILATTVAKIGLLKLSAVAGLAFGVLALGIDAIVSAILGRIEKDKLEDTIDDLQKSLDQFKPASQDYYGTITRTEIYMEIYLDV